MSLNIVFNFKEQKIVIIYDGQEYSSHLSITSYPYWKRASYTLTLNQDKKWHFEWSCYNNREQFVKIEEYRKNSDYLKGNGNTCITLGCWKYNHDPSKYTIQTNHVLGKNNTSLKIFFETIGVASAVKALVDEGRVINIDDFSNETYIDLSYGKSKSSVSKDAKHDMTWDNKTIRV